MKFLNWIYAFSVFCLVLVFSGSLSSVLAQTTTPEEVIQEQPVYFLSMRETSNLDDAPGMGVAGDFRFAELTGRLFALIEGNAGALVMVIAGIAALVSAAFGAFRAAISLLVVAVGAFILRSLVVIFFNYTPTF